MEKPDLIIVAVEAAKVAPLAVEQRLRTPEGPRTVPVIVISDCPGLEPELLDVFDFIPAPLDASRLLDDIASIAGRPAKPGHPGVLCQREYRELSDHILSCTGLLFEARNRSLLERGVGKRMSALRFERCSDYLAYLKRHGEDRHELQKLLQFLTVGESYFFRYPSHCDARKERLSGKAMRPELPIRIWSAGCSTGEEPYSIAISVMEALPDWRDRDIRIIATDINDRSIKKARDGVYAPWSMRATQPRHLERYFDRAGESFRVREEVKGLVEFTRANLAFPPGRGGEAELRDLDAVFCRNVLIYLGEESAARALQGFGAALKPAGQLFLGHAETLLQGSLDLELRLREDTFFYVKRERPARRPAPPVPRQGAPLPPLLSPAQPEADRATTLESAQRLFDAGKPDAAHELIERLLGEHPEETGALILKGLILAGKGHLEEALDTCCRVMALNDLLPGAYLLKGVVLDASGRWGEAAEEYRKALLLEHDFIMPRYQMGWLHLRLGRVVDAAREIRNSMRMLAGRGADWTIPYSGGLTSAGCLAQLENALARSA